MIKLFLNAYKTLSFSTICTYKLSELSNKNFRFKQKEGFKISKPNIEKYKSFIAEKPKNKESEHKTSDKKEENQKILNKGQPKIKVKKNFSSKNKKNAHNKKNKKNSKKIEKNKKNNKKNYQEKEVIVSEDKMKEFEFEHKVPLASMKDAPKRSNEIRTQRKTQKDFLKPDLNNFFIKLLENKRMISAASKFSQFDLLSLLRNDKLYKSEKNAEKFNFILTIIRKQKPLTFYERPEIMRALEFINENLSQVLPENISQYAVNLSKMRIDKLEYYKQLEQYILENSFKFTVRDLANITHSFVFISKKLNILTDFQFMFQQLESIIALKFKQNSVIDPKSINQIMIAYSKTQNFSKEFLFFLERICFDNFDNFNTQEISNILYSFYKNKYNSEALLEKLENHFTKNTEKYKIKEIAMCIEVFANSERMNEKILKIMKKILKTRSNQFNIQDFSVFIKYLLINSALDKSTSKIISEMFKELYGNIDQNCFARLSFNLAQNYNSDILKKTYMKYWVKSLKFLIKENKLRGRYLLLIKQQAKEINDKILKERILKHLRKI